MAMRTMRCVARRLTGFTPIPESARIRLPVPASISSFRKRSTFFASSLPFFHSIPAYTSSVFSRKITMLTCSGLRTGDGTPGT